MPKISEMRESKFLKKEDVGAGMLMTVQSVEQHNVAKEGAEHEMKWCMSFAEADKPLVLNSTNIQMCAKVFASEDTDDWTGKRIVLYNDPNVSYAGKIIGGIRVRAPKLKAATAAAKPVPVPEPAIEITEDNIPFAWLLPLVLPALGLMGLVA